MLRHRLEALLWAGGAVCLGYCLYVSAQTAASLRAAGHIAVESAASKKPALVRIDSEGDVIGAIRIPALGLTAPITADFDPASLRHGVGHISGTAMPGGLGTTGLAGHRDSFFRPLRGIKQNMTILLSNKTGTYRYTVDSTEIVTPDRVQVLDVTSRPELTLVTCYPFDYVGSAPKRFIVHAHLLSLMPEHGGVP